MTKEELFSIAFSIQKISLAVDDMTLKKIKPELDKIQNVLERLVVEDEIK